MMDLPQHVAIIPDGNRRWAELHNVSQLEGHRAGARTMHNVVEYLLEQEIHYLTVWGFSADNWKRSKDEVRDIFHLLASWIKTDAPWLNEHHVRLRYIGRIAELPRSLQRAINDAIDLTKDNAGMTLTMAFNYSGQAEIVDAVRQIVSNRVPFNLVNSGLFSQYLYTDGMPDVDLVIRTAGELRLSNFLLWQTAYSEYHFSKVLWPDFDREELIGALLSYSERKRRFGGD